MAPSPPLADHHRRPPPRDCFPRGRIPGGVRSQIPTISHRTCVAQKAKRHCHCCHCFRKGRPVLGKDPSRYTQIVVSRRQHHSVRRFHHQPRIFTAGSRPPTASSGRWCVSHTQELADVALQMDPDTAPGEPRSPVSNFGGVLWQPEGQDSGRPRIGYGHALRHRDERNRWQSRLPGGAEVLHLLP